MRDTIRHGRFLLLALVLALLTLSGVAAAQNSESTEDPESAAQEPEPTASEGEEPIIELQSGEEAVANQIIVKFKEETSGAAKEDARSDEGLEKKEDLDLIDAEVAKVEGQSVEDTISDLNNRPEVEYAEPDHIVYPSGYKDEPGFKSGDLWGLHNTGQPIKGSTGTVNVDINAPEASAITQGDEDLVVAVIDDGVDFSHPELKDRAWKNPGESGGGKETNGVDDDGNGLVDDVNGWDFHNLDNTVHDVSDFHGTHVSGTIAASVNGDGVVGVAPDVEVMALKFIGPRGGATSNAIKAIEYAKNKGAKISNNSWGGAGYNQALKDAIDKSDMLFVASAGNSGNDLDKKDTDGKLVQPQYPASYESSNILSVSAIDNKGNLSGFSNYGVKSVDISAPGQSILSSIPDRPDLPAVALSSVDSSGKAAAAGLGKAVTAGFGADEINDKAGRVSFMKKAFEAVGRGNQNVLLVDDDASNCLGLQDVGTPLSETIKSITGKDPALRETSCGRSAPPSSFDTSRILVWATGQAPYSSNVGDITRNLTSDDRTNLTNFLKGGGKLILTGMDALALNENDTFVIDTLGLTVQPDVNHLKASFNGSPGTAFAGESYDLNSSTNNPDLHDALTSSGSGVKTQGIYPKRDPWDFLNGTSMAAPHATGAASLAASINPALLESPKDLKKSVMDSGKLAGEIADGKTVTGAMVDARAILTEADVAKPQLKLPSDITEEATSKDGAVVSFSATATDNIDGDDVSVSCASDSGLESGSTFPIGTTPVTCSAKDEKGNEATGSFNVTVQDTRGPDLQLPPDITEEATSKDGVAVSYEVSAADTVDGSVTPSCSPASGSTFALGTNTVTCSAKDSADNETKGTFKVIVQDTTKPEVECDDADGVWHKDNVGVRCTASDIFLTNSDDASFLLYTNVSNGTETDDASTESRKVCDTSNNCVTAGPIGGNKVDRKAPEVSINSPKDGDEYKLKQTVKADYTCNDDGSGVNKCEGPASSDANLDTNSVGQKTFEVKATDKAGNEATASRSYSVVYDFKGFSSPIDNLPALNKRNAGNAVPVKFSLTGEQSLKVFAEGYPKSQQISCSSADKVDGKEPTATAGSSGLSYDANSDQYSYAWKTEKSWAGTCRQLVVKLNDGTFHRANFRFT